MKNWNKDIFGVVTGDGALLRYEDDKDVVCIMDKSFAGLRDCVTRKSVLVENTCGIIISVKDATDRGITLIV